MYFAIESELPSPPETPDCAVCPLHKIADVEAERDALKAEVERLKHQADKAIAALRGEEEGHE